MSLTYLSTLVPINDRAMFWRRSGETVSGPWPTGSLPCDRASGRTPSYSPIVLVEVTAVIFSLFYGCTVCKVKGRATTIVPVFRTDIRNYFTDSDPYFQRESIEKILDFPVRDVL